MASLVSAIFYSNPNVYRGEENEAMFLPFTWQTPPNSTSCKILAGTLAALALSKITDEGASSWLSNSLFAAGFIGAGVATAFVCAGPSDPPSSNSPRGGGRDSARSEPSMMERTSFGGWLVAGAVAVGLAAIARFAGPGAGQAVWQGVKQAAGVMIVTSPEWMPPQPRSPWYDAETNPNGAL